MPDLKYIELNRLPNKRLHSLHFEKKFIPLLNERGLDVAPVPNLGAFSVKKDKEHLFNFYPKANKIHIHKGNQWIDNGFFYIIKNFLQQNQTPFVQSNKKYMVSFYHNKIRLIQTFVNTSKGEDYAVFVAEAKLWNNFTPCVELTHEVEEL